MLQEKKKKPVQSRREREGEKERERAIHHLECVASCSTDVNTLCVGGIGGHDGLTDKYTHTHSCQYNKAHHVVASSAENKANPMTKAITL